MTSGDSMARQRARDAFSAAVNQACDTSIFRWPQQEDLDPILDAVLDVLRDVVDEIDGALIPTTAGADICIHTTEQVCEWLSDLMAVRIE